MTYCMGPFGYTLSLYGVFIRSERKRTYIPVSRAPLLFY